jgi:phosphoribosylaminoimidazole (AIR) synthetase
MQDNSYKVEVIDPGDRASRFAKEIGFLSHQNNPAVIIVPHEPNNFRGPVGWLWRKDIQERMGYTENGDGINWDIMEEMENDGAGGKSQFFTLIGTREVFHNLGWEIIAMTADDFARSGRLPIIICNELQAKRITERNFHLVEELFTGYGQALKESNLVNITGEIAIMKHSITAFCDTKVDDQLIVTWGASCVGLASKELLLNPANIKPGMTIVGFEDPGYRCNGGTFFTNLILREFGPEIERIINNPDAMDFVMKLTAPSKSYAKTVCRLVGWNSDGTPGEPLADIKGIAHITGGGLGKFQELLPAGVGAHLDYMPLPAEVLLEAQKMSQKYPDLALTDEDCYRTIHGGCGMLLVVDGLNDCLKIIEEARKDGIRAQRVGFTNDSGKLTVDSMFMRSDARLTL